MYVNVDLRLFGQRQGHLSPIDGHHGPPTSAHAENLRSRAEHLLEFLFQ